MQVRHPFCSWDRNWLVWAFTDRINGNGVFPCFQMNSTSGQRSLWEAQRNTVKSLSFFLWEPDTQGRACCLSTFWGLVQLAVWWKETALRGKALGEWLHCSQLCWQVELAAVDPHCPDYRSKTNKAPSTLSSHSLGSCWHRQLGILLSHAKDFVLAFHGALTIILTFNF